MKRKKCKKNIRIGDMTMTIVAGKQTAFDGEKIKNHTEVYFYIKGISGFPTINQGKALSTIKKVFKAALDLPTHGRPILIEGTCIKRMRVYMALLKRAEIPFQFFPKLLEEDSYLTIRPEDWPGN